MRPGPGWILPALLCLACCGGPDGESPAEPLTVYSGRNENLIGPLLDRFSASTGIEVKVRYGGTAELAATLLEEGHRTPASVFISQDAAALGALSTAGLLRPLPATLLDRLAPRFRGPEGDWIGLSGRARVVVYNPDLIEAARLPQTLSDAGNPEYRGRFGIAPTNASFQAHMALVLALQGEPALVELLARLAANEPVRFPNNGAIVQAVVAGEVEWGLVNHYYLWRVLGEDPQARGRNRFMSGDEASAFLNLSGAALLRDGEQALTLLDYLLSETAQRYFAETTYEYPLVPGIEPAVDLPRLDELRIADVDYAELSRALPRAQLLIEQSGLNRF